MADVQTLHLKRSYRSFTPRPHNSCERARDRMATTAWFRDAYIILHADRDGTLGYSDGMTYYPVYGRLQLASGVPPATANISQQMERLTKIRLGLEQAGLEHTLRASYRREETITLDNILFKYEETRGVYQTEVAYVQEEWNSRHYVRRLFSSALRGRGAMLSSIENRVYVLDSSIPRPSPWIKRGYLKVGSSDLVSPESPVETVSAQRNK